MHRQVRHLPVREAVQLMPDRFYHESVTESVTRPAGVSPAFGSPLSLRRRLHRPQILLEPGHNPLRHIHEELGLARPVRRARIDDHLRLHPQPPQRIEELLALREGDAQSTPASRSERSP